MIGLNRRTAPNSQSYVWPMVLFTIGVFIAGLDNGIISVALTTISETFQVSPSWGAWSVTIYTLGVAMSVPIIGKLSDRYGRKRLFLMEILIFGIGSLCVAISPNFTFLIISRFVQSIGGGGIFIIGSSYILDTLPPNKQGKALGLLGGMHGLSSVVGPNLGALILSITGSWQWMFLINIPIVFLLFLYGRSKLNETRSKGRGRLDLIGSLLLGSSMLMMMFGITNLGENNIFTNLFGGQVLPLFLIGSALLLLLLLYERYLESRGGDPIVAYSLIRQRGFQVTILLGLLSGGFLAGIIFVPSFVEHVLQIPVEYAGYWLTPMALAATVGAGFGGVFTDKYGAVPAVTIAGFLGVTGFGLFMLVHELGLFVIASILAGFGLGILLGAPLNVLVGDLSPRGEKGSALGMLALIRQLGLTLFPVLYARFLTVSYGRIERHLNQSQDFQETSNSFINMGGLIGEIGKIDDVFLRRDMLTVVMNGIRSGFTNLYFIASILAILVIMIGLYLQHVFEHRVQIGDRS